MLTRTFSTAWLAPVLLLQLLCAGNASAAEKESSELRDRQIQQSAKALQAACDSKRLQLKNEFWSKMILPLKQEADSLVLQVSPAERQRLQELLSRPSEESTRLLQSISKRLPSTPGTEIFVLPGSPAPAFAIVGPEQSWGSKKVRAQVRWSGGAYEYVLASPFSQNNAQEIIESRLDLECRVFLTGWNLSTLYSFANDAPKPGDARALAKRDASPALEPELLDLRLALRPLDSLYSGDTAAYVTEAQVKGISTDVGTAEPVSNKASGTSGSLGSGLR